jgi:hypothetical protein
VTPLSRHCVERQPSHSSYISGTGRAKSKHAAPQVAQVAAPPQAQAPASNGHAYSAEGARGTPASSSSLSLASLSPSLAALGALHHPTHVAKPRPSIVQGCYCLCCTRRKSLSGSHAAGNGDDGVGAGGWGSSAGLLPGLDMRCVMWGLLSTTAPEDMLSACLRLVSI